MVTNGLVNTKPLLQVKEQLRSDLLSQRILYCLRTDGLRNQLSSN